MKHLRNIVGAYLSAALLVACGGVNNGLSPSTPMSVAPPLAPQSLRSQPAAGGHASQRTNKNAQTESVLHLFTGTHGDGANPFAALLNVNGTLYGTTEGGGGRLGQGTVFKITTSGTYTQLYTFAGGADGSYPEARLLNLNGALYGTTEFGGTANKGTVFKVTTSGTETVLHTFGGSGDGANPIAGLTSVNGTLYGTTKFGGTTNHGTVFKVTTSGNETALYSFAGGTDGTSPFAGLTSVNGTLYGTTFGITSRRNHPFGCDSECGTVFKITTSGTYTQLYRFPGGEGGKFGEHPYGDLTKVGHTLYGASQDGRYGHGAIFKITTSGTYTQLYRFAGGADGEYSNGGLLNLDGTLYGTTNYGGAHNLGTIFALANSGQETVVYSFAGGRDGNTPTAGLINVGGTLYGTTYQHVPGPPSGRHKWGTVFSLSF